MKTIQATSLQFLSNLAKNNNREWFTVNKNLYTAAHEDVTAFVDELIVKMNKHDELETVSGNKALYRIYKDVRFSKDKTPYNPRFAFNLQRATKFKRGGYYVLLKPGASFLGCGFFAPSPADLKTIREDISYNYEEWNKLINLPEIKKNFGAIQGEQGASAPRGFDKNHPAIDLIRHKQFIFRKDFTDKEVCSPEFLDQVDALFKSIRPFFDYMSEVLTLDGNGESIS